MMSQNPKPGRPFSVLDVQRGGRKHPLAIISELHLTIYWGFNKSMSKLNSNYSILYTFDPDDSQIKLDGPQNRFYIQTSLLYTNERRQRLIRVHNYALKITDQLKEVYNNINYQALLATVMRQNIAQFSSLKPFVDIQIDITNTMKKIFAGIAHHSSHKVQEDLLPYLALGFLGILKNIVFQAQYINNCRLISCKQ